MPAKRGDHLKFHCGDHVYNAADPRHVGRIISIAGAIAEVKWDNGIYETLFLSDLKPAVRS
jgi:hypothetical protein